MRMIANYEGIGPMFKVILELTNESKEPISGSRIVLNCDETVYKVRGRYPVLPLMLPGLNYRVSFDVENIEATGAPDTIQVFVIDDSWSDAVNGNVTNVRLEDAWFPGAVTSNLSELGFASDRRHGTDELESK